MQTSEYFERIGFEGRVAPDLDSLRSLHLAHLRAVPFENLDIGRGVEIVLDLNKLYKKIVGNGRGGFCYELNGLFGWLLGELGFEVEMLSARVFGRDGNLGPDFDHMLLRVNKDFIADVGFGDCFVEPMRFDETIQEQPNGKFRLVKSDGIFELQRESEGIWKPQYTFTDEPRELPEFDEMCKFQQTSPESIFTQKSICSMATAEGRVTISDDRYIETREGEVVERKIRSEADRLELLRERFGINFVEA